MAYPPPPYADALCGTPLCGEAICGAWWVYPASAGLGLAATAPTVVILGGDEIPSAGLGLGASAPQIRIDNGASPPSAGLGLAASAPDLRLSQVLAVLSAGLGMGADVPVSASIVYLHSIECREGEGTIVGTFLVGQRRVGSPIYVLVDTEEDLLLVEAPSYDLVL